LGLSEPLCAESGSSFSNSHTNYQFYTVPSPFDSARWPTYFRPVVSLNKGSTDEEWGRIAEVVHDYMHRYSSVKGIIHVSAANQVERVSTRIKGCASCSLRIQTPRPGLVRHALFRQFREDATSWLIHYSAGEGESFDDDTARIQLIAKVPFGDLSDKLTRLRSEEPGMGSRFYAAVTAGRIAQTAGRVMRHQDDYGETVILDGAFRRLWTWHKDVFPSWFSDILHM
ncbi:hypothetical protein LCGC14_1817910, partial [marine sediment metagenome]